MQQTRLHLNAGGAEPGNATPAHARIGIMAIGNDNAADAGGDQGVRAGRRPAVMRARLEGDVRGAPICPGAGARQGHGLGMRATTRLRGRFADHDATLRDHTTDGRIGPGRPWQPESGDRTPHQHLVELRPGTDARDGRRGRGRDQLRR